MLIVIFQDGFLPNGFFSACILENALLWLVARNYIIPTIIEGFYSISKSTMCQVLMPTTNIFIFELFGCMGV